MSAESYNSPLDMGTEPRDHIIELSAAYDDVVADLLPHLRPNVYSIGQLTTQASGLASEEHSQEVFAQESRRVMTSLARYPQQIAELKDSRYWYVMPKVEGNEIQTPSPLDEVTDFIERELRPRWNDNKQLFRQTSVQEWLNMAADGSIIDPAHRKSHAMLFVKLFKNHPLLFIPHESGEVFKLNNGTIVPPPATVGEAIDNTAAKLSNVTIRREGDFIYQHFPSRQLALCSLKAYSQALQEDERFTHIGNASHGEPVYRLEGSTDNYNIGYVEHRLAHIVSLMREKGQQAVRLHDLHHFMFRGKGSKKSAAKMYEALDLLLSASPDLEKRHHTGVAILYLRDPAQTAPPSIPIEERIDGAEASTPGYIDTLARYIVERYVDSNTATISTSRLVELAQQHRGRQGLSALTETGVKQLIARFAYEDVLERSAGAPDFFTVKSQSWPIALKGHKVENIVQLRGRTPRKVSSLNDKERLLHITAVED